MVSLMLPYYSLLWFSRFCWLWLWHSCGFGRFGWKQTGKPPFTTLTIRRTSDTATHGPNVFTLFWDMSIKKKIKKKMQLLIISYNNRNAYYEERTRNMYINREVSAPRTINISCHRDKGKKMWAVWTGRDTSSEMQYSVAQVH